MSFPEFKPSSEGATVRTPPVLENPELNEGQLNRTTGASRVTPSTSDRTLSRMELFRSFAYSGLERARSLLGRASAYFSGEESELELEGGQEPRESVPSRPIHNTMRFLFGLVEIKALDSIEQILSAGNIQRNVADNWGDRNKQGHTLVEALQQLKEEFLEKQREVEQKRHYPVNFLEATGPDEDTEEARLAHEENIQKLHERLKKFDLLDRKWLEPTLQQIDKIIEQINALKVQ